MQWWFSIFSLSLSRCYHIPNRIIAEICFFCLNFIIVDDVWHMYVYEFFIQCSSIDVWPVSKYLIVNVSWSLTILSIVIRRGEHIGCPICLERICQNWKLSANKMQSTSAKTTANFIELFFAVNWLPSPYLQFTVTH